MDGSSSRCATPKLLRVRLDMRIQVFNRAKRNFLEVTVKPSKKFPKLLIASFFIDCDHDRSHVGRTKPYVGNLASEFRRE